MKKLLLFLVLFLSLTINMNAQRTYYHRYYHNAPAREYRHRSYHEPRGERYSAPMGAFRFHIIGDIGTCEFPRVFWRYRPVHFTAGAMAEYQVGQVVSLGLGAEFYSTYYSRYYSNYYYLRSLPIYGNLRFSIPSGPVRPFIEGRIGYAPSLNTIAYGSEQYSSGGLYTGGTIGLTIYNLNLGFGISAVDVMKRTSGYYAQDFIVDYSFRISFAFGRPY